MLGRYNDADAYYALVALYYMDEGLTPDATCLLPDGHTGPHEWTPDEDITITFPPAKPVRP